MSHNFNISMISIQTVKVHYFNTCDFRKRNFDDLFHFNDNYVHAQ